MVQVGTSPLGMKAFLPKGHRKLLVLCVQVIQYGQKLSDATMLLLGLAAPGEGAQALQLVWC